MITFDGQLALLNQLRRVPLDPLVAALRDLHHRGAADSELLQSLLAPGRAAAPGAPERVADEAAGPRINLAHDVDYEKARSHFAEHGRRLREQAILAERLLGSFAARRTEGPASSLQHELTVSGTPGDVATTRFVVVNREVRAIQVRFVADNRDPDSQAKGLAGTFKFSPDAPRLLPDEQVVITLSVVLPVMDGYPDTVGVDVLGDDRLLVRLWVVMRVINPSAR